MKLFVLLLIFSAQVFSQEESLGQSSNFDFKMHKENYLFPLMRISPLPREAQDKSEFKYQFSLKYTPFKIGNGEFSIAYTQKSFWQVYDSANSRPFRETNYNPEGFIRYRFSKSSLDFGYEHESNGQEDPASRSWDRFFIRWGTFSSVFKLVFKYWVIFDEDLIGPQYPERTRSIQDFYGNYDIDIGFYAFGTIFKSYGRYNFSDDNGFVEIKSLWPINKHVLWGFTYTKGYGDSLRSYNINHETYGFGIVMNP
ncbi:MAG: phospholipase A [Bacteriovoracaceae bacterium]|nr:phospholipase A [Bacteriovoracaceae bacterium]